MKLYILRFVAAAENVYYLVSHTFGNKSSCRSEILTRIEVRRIFCEVTTYSCSAGKSEVGVDIYLQTAMLAALRNISSGTPLAPFMLPPNSFMV